MPAKILSPVSDCDDDNRKQQMGCINIHKIFNRNHHNKGLLLPPDIRDVGKKDSMRRETRILSIKTRKDKDAAAAASLMSYTDSPRPLPGNAKVHGLTLPRHSYDERESRAVMKVVNESPRFSLDSRASATKVSLDLRMGNENHPIKQHQSSIIAKLMGLEPFPETTTTTAKASEIHKTSSASQKDSAAIPAMSLKEPAPLRRRGCGQGRRMSRSGKPPPNESSSVYAEIERMITEFEFMSSNKDLRALEKQILDSKQKANQSLEKQRRAHGTLRHGCSESKCLNQKPELLSSAYQQDPAVRRRCFQKTSTFPAMINNSNSNGKASTVVSSCIHVSAIQNLKHQRENTDSACNKKGEVLLTPRNDKKTIRKDLQTSKLPELKIEKSIRMSPRNQLKVQGEFPSTCSSSNSGNHNKNLCSSSRKSTRRKKVSSKSSVHLQSDDEQTSEKSNDDTRRYSWNQGDDTASIKSEGNNSEVVSQIETDGTSFLPNSIITSSREQKQRRSSAESLPNVADHQPSPVSVLDNTFYSEDISSPVEKISTAFQDDEGICPWYSEKNPVHGFENHNQRYMNETLLSSRHLKNSSMSSRPSSNQALCSWLPNDSKTFREEPIEAGKWKKHSNDEKKLNKIVADMEKEILIRKTTMGGLFTRGRKGGIITSSSMQAVKKEVGLEIEQVCNMERCWEVDDDGMKKLLNADLKHHQSEDWMDFSGEVPYLVLDIERKIFKDLINEVVLTAELLQTSPKKAGH